MTDFKKAVVPLSTTLVFDEKDAGEGKVFLGMQVTGDYVEMKENIGPNESRVYVIRVDDKLYSIWGSQLLDEKFDKGDNGRPVPVGSVIRLTCNGKKFGKTGFSKTKGYWDYDLEFAPANPTFQKAANEKADEAGY